MMMVAKGPSVCLFLTLLCSVIICSSGTLVGFSFHATGKTAATSNRTISFLQPNNVSPSQIRAFVADHTVLTTFSNSSISIDLHLNESLVENLISSYSSAVSWLKTNLLTFLPHVDLKSITITRPHNDSEGLTELVKLFSTLKSIRSLLRSFNLHKEVKVSVAFSLSFLQKSKSTRNVRELHKVFDFIKNTQSFVIVGAIIDGKVNRGDQFVQSVIEAANLATSTLPCHDVPILLTIKCLAVPRATEVANFTTQVEKSLENNFKITSRVAALYVELPEMEVVEKESDREEKHFFLSSHRQLLSSIKKTQHDDIIPPTTTFPTVPTSTTPPVSFLPNNPTPTIVNVPSTYPVTITPTNPADTPTPIPTTTPVTLPSTDPNNSTVPTTNPVTTPAPITMPGAGAPPATNPVTISPPPPTGGVPVSTSPPAVTNSVPPPAPVTNPVTTSPPPSTGGVPVSTPPPVTNSVPPPASTTNAPATPGQSWCVAKTGASQTSLQAALDYACGKLDCSQIQQGASCYNPNTLQNHASYAFNSYYQKNPSPTTCDFGGTATIVNTNPSSGSCIFPSSASKSTPSAPPTSTATPTATPPSTSGAGAPPGSIKPPTVLNSSTPGSSSTTVFGSEIPPSVNTTTTDESAGSKPFMSCIMLLTCFVPVVNFLDM